MRKKLLTVLALLLAWPTLLPAEESARERLLKVAEATRELARKGKESDQANVVKPHRADDAQEASARTFPTRGDLARYMQLRPWTRQYTARFDYQSLGREPRAALPRWPQPADAAVLRELLAHKDPVVRSLAVEALATLHEPEDVARIARLLDDEAEGLAGLGWNYIMTALALPTEMKPLGKPDAVVAGDNDVVELRRGWHSRKVKTYARAALLLMTGQNLDAKNFAAWWQRHRDGRQCVWYWQERLHRELAEAAAAPFPAWEEKSDGETFEEWLKKRQEDESQRRAAVIRAVRDELRKLPPEVEAKVCLLALNQYTTALGAELDGPLLGKTEALRLSADRLLDLLDRKDLWEDVDWSSDESRAAYSAIVVQLLGAAEKFFRPEHVKRLEELRAREDRNVWWNGQAALCIGISRLLPLADAEELDDVKTRDGVLRDAVRRHRELFVRGAVAREMIRVSLEPNWKFLEQEFFAERDQSGIPDLRMSILQELGAPPLTPAKRAALAKLLLDERYEPLWTRLNRQMGDDMHRVYAIWAVNAHAGKEVLTTAHHQDLTNAEKAAKTLAEVKKTVAEILGVQPARTP